MCRRPSFRQSRLAHHGEVIVTIATIKRPRQLERPPLDRKRLPLDMQHRIAAADAEQVGIEPGRQFRTPLPERLDRANAGGIQRPYSESPNSRLPPGRSAASTAHSIAVGDPPQSRARVVRARIRSFRPSGRSTTRNGKEHAYALDSEKPGFEMRLHRHRRERDFSLRSNVSEISRRSLARTCACSACSAWRLRSSNGEPG